MRKLLSAAAFLALSVFWACHLDPEDNQDHFDLIGDSTWTSCDSVVVVLLDAKGQALDTLFKGKLDALSQLKSLSAAKYDGSSATLRIRGLNESGLCFEEDRNFQGDGQSLKVDTIKSLTALPLEVVLDPESLSVSLDGSEVPVQASILPAYADQAVKFALSADGVVSLTKPTGGDGNLVKIKPEKIGNTTILVSSIKDPAKTSVLKIRILPPSGNKVTLDKDSVLLYVGGAGATLVATVEPATVDQAVTWRSMNPDVVTVDSAGQVKPVGVGETYVNAKSVATGESQSGLVIVKRDIPVLTVASKAGAPVNTRIAFSPHTSQKYGSILMFKWDLDGDGNWDDSSSVLGVGTEVDLQTQFAEYAKEGLYTAKFYVRDTEGNEATAEVLVDIGNQAPEITAIRHDTLISIKDSISMTASVRDVDGKVAWYGWDYDGNGVFDDSGTSSDSSVEIVMGHRYPDAGLHLAILMAKDETGKTRIDTVKVKVELDRPVADAGEDITVTVGSAVTLHLDGTDKFGSIEKREVRFDGSGTGFHVLSKPDTTFTAPDEPGAYLVVLKVTDDDGLVDVDSMNLNVILSANADLSSLVFSAGTLTPAFKPAIQFFSGHADFADSSVTVTPTVKDPSSTISVNAKPVASGSASSPVKLVVGPNINVFQIVVTAADGTQRVYQVSVDRDPSADATLSKLDVSGFILKPAFASKTVEYSDTVASSAASITLKPTLAVSTATLAVNDSAMASGTATYPMPLNIGENVFKIAVTSQSGTAKTVYQIKVHRRAQLVLLRSLGGKPATQTDSSEVLAGSPRSILSPPVTGYKFVKWSVLEGTAVIANSDTNPSALTLNSAKARILADFAINKYVISAGANTGGSISPSGSVSIDHGGDAAFAITVNPGFRLKALTVDGADATAGVVAGTFTFKNVIADHAISAAFVKVDTLTTKFPSPGGKITAAKIVVDNGTDTAFYVTTDAGFAVKTFLDNGVNKLAQIGAGGRYPIKADGNHLVEATWVRGFELIGSASAGGDINPKLINVEEGSTQVFDITVNPGYRIKSLLDNGVDSTSRISGNKYTIAKIDKPHTVGVVFQRQYNIAVTVTGPGKVSPEGGLIDADLSRTFKIEPEAGAKIDSMWVDGAATPPKSSVSFDKVSGDHSLVVKFLKTYLITTTWGASGLANGLGGSISPANPTVDLAKNQVFAINPNSGFRLKTLSLDGTPVNPPVANYTLTNVTAIHTLAAGFWKTYAMKGKTNGNGLITPADSTVDSASGMQWKFGPKSDRYRFRGLWDNGTEVKTGVVTEYLISGVASARACSVFYSRIFKVETVPVAGGTITASNLSVDSNATPTITATPDPTVNGVGYRVSGMLDNGSLVTLTGTGAAKAYLMLPVTADHIITPAFKRTFSVTGKVSAGLGKIDPSSGTVDDGDPLDFKYEAQSGYHVSAMTDNGVAVAFNRTAGTYSIAKVGEIHDVVITFAINPEFYTTKVVSNMRTVSGKITTGPTLVLEVLDGETFKDDSIQVNVPVKFTAGRITAEPTFVDCSGILCTDVVFQYWLVEKKQVTENPYEIPITGDRVFRAVYGTGGREF